MRTLDGAPADTRRVGERWQTHLPTGSQIQMILVEHPDELPRIDAETGFQLAVGPPGGLRAGQEAHHRLEPFPGAVECGVDAAFDRSREWFKSVVGFLHGSPAAGLT